MRVGAACVTLSAQARTWGLRSARVGKPLAGETHADSQVRRLPSKRVKRQATGREETFTVHISDTKPVPRICKERSDLNSQKTVQSGRGQNT